MDELKTLYRNSLRPRIDELIAARAAHTAADPAAAVKLRRIAHALRGSGGTYGFPEISAAAARVEDAHATELIACVDTLISLLNDTAADT